MGVHIDGVDLETLGVVTRRGIDGLRGTPNFQWPTAEVAGRYGPLVTSSRPNVSSRELVIPCAVKKQATYADTRAAIREVASRLEPHRDSDRLVEFPDEQGSKEFRARLRGISGRQVGPDWLNVRIDFTIRLVAHDPRYFDVSGSSVSLSTTAADVALGTAPVYPTVTMPTATLEYLDSGGTVVASLTLAGSNGPYTVDFRAQTITNTNDNPEPGAFDSGEFFRLDPADGDEPASVWPQLRLTSGSGSADYTRAWWL